MDSRTETREQLQQDVSIRRSQGKSARKEVPRGSHGAWQPAPDRADPLALLQAQDSGRIRHLLPIKYGRMAASPFAFLRGSAVVMAADLANTPNIGQPVALCGDAHISNFGLFASPERKLVFDMNDFDECYRGPWEWDLKRLVASVVMAGRQNSFSAKTNRKLARLATRIYREKMRFFSKAPDLDVWYFHVGAKDVQNLFEEKASKQTGKATRKSIEKALKHTQERTLEKLTHFEEGCRRINYEPPLLVPLRELGLSKNMQKLYDDEALKQKTSDTIRAIWNDYLDSLPEDRQLLLDRFRVSDIALRVGGVGSVGTRCFIILLEGAGKQDALILQLKEAGQSVLQDYLVDHGYDQQAERVVTGQQLIQATSDPFLGWHKSPISYSDYYWRQLKDMKGSFDVATMDESGFATYIALCALSLARAHARTGDPVVISSYMGKSEVLDKAMAEFAVAYADQTEKDHAALLQAIAGGRIAAQEGI